MKGLLVITPQYYFQNPCTHSIKPVTKQVKHWGRLDRDCAFFLSTVKF